MYTSGWDTGFVHQPANSPECNTLDLAFFHAIQSLQYQKCPKNIDELTAHVQEAFTKLPLDICRKVWRTAQTVMNQILLHNGNNNYELPRVGKLKVEKTAGPNISMRLPCRALIDGGALTFKYINTFLSKGKLIVVMTTFCCPHSTRCAITNVVAIVLCCAITVAIVVVVVVSHCHRHHHRLCHCP